MGNIYFWVIKFKIILENWFRTANKVVDADNLQREINKLIKKDLSEKDLIGFN